MPFFWRRRIYLQSFCRSLAQYSEIVYGETPDRIRHEGRKNYQEALSWAACWDKKAKADHMREAYDRHDENRDFVKPHVNVPRKRRVSFWRKKQLIMYRVIKLLIRKSAVGKTCRVWDWHYVHYVDNSVSNSWDNAVVATVIFCFHRSGLVNEYALMINKSLKMVKQQWRFTTIVEPTA